MQRTVNCGEVRAEHTDSEVTLNGWAHKVRDLGGLLFVDVRDRTGIVQVMFDPDDFEDPVDLRSETCLSVTGKVRMRDEKNRNPNLATGEIEVVATSYEILSQCKTLPFPVSDEEQMGKVNEELRVKHRYLDLRRPAMHRKLAIRAGAIRRIRNFLDAKGFLDVETPIFTRSTPEGARDYLVPYRLEPGKFYALPQSPQQYKQLLMVAGIERYYQIAKCFRDEAQRADRQPEFTQLDLEMSFVTQEDILELTEELTIEVVNGLIDEFSLEKEKIGGFARLTYDESMERYASDKPDLRFDLEVFEVTKEVEGCEFGVFSGCVKSGGRVRGLRHPGGSGLSRKEVDVLEAFCKENGAKGMAYIFVQDSAADGTKEINGLHVRSSIVKFFSDEELAAILTQSKAEAGDLLCFIADSWETGNEVLGRLRNLIGDRCGLRDPKKLSFVFVVDFPLVDWNEDEQRWNPTHHPFTSPKAADMDLIDTDPGKIRADCYDVVCNGTEWASGSIRIHQPDVQKRIFSLIGIDEKEQKERFSHIIEAFEFGAPPHGGIAPGIDRLIMFLTGDENIREVIAFPKMGGGYDPMMDAPSTVDAKQWEEMGLELASPDESSD
ncbi:MAG: aspartate--tRNA ligase [Armatimonadetes bacterium]|nr:aspartate--tRNA ligase [Armatimonadota bacterium]